jgi:hypothetical protein
MNRVTHFEIYTNEERGGKICVPKMAIPKVPSLAYAEDGRKCFWNYRTE